MWRNPYTVGSSTLLRIRPNGTEEPGASQASARVESVPQASYVAPARRSFAALVLALLQRQDRKFLAHPSMWAPFILAGEANR